MSTPEQAVRTYLQFLKDPDLVRDHAAIAEATQISQQAEDPLEQLKALSALQALESVDGSVYLADFVSHAAGWARDNNVTPEAFMQLGVPTDVLADAGLIESPRPPAVASKKRRTRVSPEEVAAAIPSGSFTIAELEAASGASTATVRKVIAEMTEAGSLRDLGPKEDHSGRGRAPLLFRKS